MHLRHGVGRWGWVCLAWLLGWHLQASLGWAQAPLRKIGEMDLAVFGLTATVDPTNPVVPKNIGAGVRIVLRAGPNELSSGDIFQFLGGPFRVEGEYSGPGLTDTLTLLEEVNAPSAAPLILRLPAVPVSGDYDLRNLRITRRINNSTTTILDVTPTHVPVTVIEQVLITSVTTRPLSMQEIRDKGILLDSDDYLGFQFTLGMKLESKVVKLDFPVVFDRQNIRPPQIGEASTDVPLEGVQYQVPKIVPLMLEGIEGISAGERLMLEDGQSVELKIPGLLVIPGDVGYLNQMFSAQLFVANGAPVGAPLTVRNVKGTIDLPKGPDPQHDDDPLTLANLVSGPQSATQDVVQVGPDGQPGTPDDVARLMPGEQGQAEFLLVGEKEGFHPFKVAIEATLEGLITGPTTVKGLAQGAVLVRNPYFNVTFTVPTVVRTGELFSMFVTLNNIGQGTANDVSVTIDEDAASGAELQGDPVARVDTIRAGDAHTFEYKFRSLKTGAVVAHYLRLDGAGDGHTGNIRMKVMVGERGVPLSPDTLALPTVVSRVPQKVVNAAMRVLGQAWSNANAPAGTLPAGVLRISKQVATERALLLAETGLRITLRQPEVDALRDFATDFYGGGKFDAAFDQLLRNTIAGHDLNRELGAALHTRTDLSTLYSGLTDVMTAGPDTAAIALTTSTPHLVDAAVVDAAGKRASADHRVTVPGTDVAGAAFFTLAPVETQAGTETLGVLTSVAGSPYTIELSGKSTGAVALSVTYPVQGSWRRATIAGVEVTPTWRGRVTFDPFTSDSPVLLEDVNGDGAPDNTRPLTALGVTPTGPELLSASVIGPETLTDAAPFGLNTALLFDRRVDAAAARQVERYAIPNNGMHAASRQLSGRLVFGALKAPEGPNVPTRLSVTGLPDTRGVMGPFGDVVLTSLLTDPGAVVVGRVMQADSTPVTGVSVFYSQNPAWSTCDPKYGYTTLSAIPVDANGQFELRYVRKDTCGMPFDLRTADPQFGTVRKLSAYVRGANDRMQLDLVLLGRGSVTGFVYDQNGDVIAGAKVIAVSQTDPQVGGSAITDGNGAYTIHDLVVGGVTVKAGKGTEVGSGFGVIGRAGTTGRVDVHIDRGSVDVTGTVLRLNGTAQEPVPGVTVVFETQVAQGSLIAAGVTTTNKDGAFTLENMPSGAYKVKALVSHIDQPSATGTALPGDAVHHDLIVQGNASGSVSGYVVMPAAAGEVRAANVYVFFDQRFAVTDDEGNFTIPNVSLQSNVDRPLTAMTRDGLRKATVTVRVEASRPHVTNQKLTLSGLGTAEFTVIDALGNRVRNQSVRLIRADGGCGLTLATASTNTDGVVTFEHQPVGPAIGHVLIRAGSFTDVASATAVIPADGGVGRGVLRLRGAGTVAGTVKEPDGRAVFGADVTISSNKFDMLSCSLMPGESHHVRSDENGVFRIPNVNLGPVTVSARQAFLSMDSAGGVLTTPGQELSVALVLDNTMAGELTGIVKLPDGETPAGAGVEVTLSGGLPDAMVKTNADGVYRFAKIFPEGHYTITARDPVTGGAVRAGHYLVRGQDARQDLILKGRGTVTVKVLDLNDQAVTQALVRLQEKDFPGNSYEALIDASTPGYVTFPNVYEGEVTVEVVDSVGRGGRTSGAVPAPDTTVELTVRVGMTGTVKGKFVKADGVTPVAFGQIVLTKDGRTIGQAITIGAGATQEEQEKIGTFEFNYVPAGNVRIDAEDPDSGRTGVAVGRIESEGQQLVLNVRAQAIGSVTGVVTLNGDAQKLANVLVTAGTLRANATTDEYGRYVVRGVPEGLVTVTASFDNQYLQGTGSGTIVSDDQELTIDVALRDVGEVSGRVVTYDGQAPPLTAVTLRVGGIGGGTLQTTTNANGDFSFTRVPVGMASLEADVLSSVDSGTASVEVTEGALSTATITLRGLGDLSGVTRNNQDQAIAGLLFLKGTGPVPYSYTRQTDASGAFDFYDLPAGPFTLQLRAVVGDVTLHGTASGVITPGLPKTQLDVKLQPFGSVSGTVMKANGDAAVGADVTIFLHSRNLRVDVEAQNDGTFRADGLPLDTITITVRDQSTGGVARVLGLTIQEGEDTAAGTIVLDETPIAVTGITPVNDPEGASPVAPTTPVTIAFSDPIQTTTGIVVKRGTEVIASNPSVSADRLTVTFPGPWPNPVGLVVVVPVTIADVFGRHPAQAFTSAFRTADSTPPQVTGISPAHNTSDVDASAVIVVTFSEPLDDAALTGVITVSSTAGVVAGTPTQNGSAVTFTPSLPLPTDAIYTVTVAGARDKSGNLQVGTYTTTFRTRDTVAPAITFHSPTPGSTTNQSRPEFVVHFSDSGPVASGVNVALASVVFNGGPGTLTRLTNAIRFQPTDPLTDGTYSMTVTVPDMAGNEATATASFTVLLPPTGSITGRVFRPDGSTPSVNTEVVVKLWNYVQRTTLTDTAGEFRFDDLSLATYTVEAKNAAGATRADTSLTLNTKGQVIDRTLTLLGAGRITGIVTDPSGNRAVGASVTVRSQHPRLGQRHPAVETGADGSYFVDEVLEGPVSVEATAGQGLRGTASGQILRDDEVTVNVALFAPSQINFPLTRRDGNSVEHLLARNGTLGYYDEFSALDIISDGGTVTRFAGTTGALFEENNRELVVTQDNVTAGLNVTRKIFVPRDGYFVRYLESLTNTTNASLTVGVRLTSQPGPVQIERTSSGDDVLAVHGSDPAQSDRWLSLGTNDRWSTYGTAFVFDGPGAELRLHAASITVPVASRILQSQWQGVTIGAGDTVTLMHFVTRPGVAASATAAAERLSKVPPEALAGTEASERASILNFVVPADGVGVEEALPRFDGRITGRVFAHDGTTPVPNAHVRFRSGLAMYPTWHSVYANASGEFTIEQEFANYSTRLVPIADYVLSVVHPGTLAESGEVPGEFEAEQTSDVQDVVMTSTGSLTGIVRSEHGVAMPDAQVFVGWYIGTQWMERSTVTDENGVYLFAGLAPKTYKLRSRKTHSQGIPNEMQGPEVAVTANDETTRHLDYPATATVTGFVKNADGTPAVGVLVRIADYCTWCSPAEGRSVLTDAAGAYTLAEVPPNTYFLWAGNYDDAGAPKTEITLAAGTPTRWDLDFTATATLRVEVRYANNTPAASVRLQTRRGTGSLEDLGYTNSSGVLVRTGVPLGTLAVIANYPSRHPYSSQAVVDLQQAGETVPVSITLEIGSLSGRVLFPDGSPAASATVTASVAADQAASVETDASGAYTFPYMWVNQPVTLRASLGTSLGTVTTTVLPGSSTPVDITIHEQATVRVLVKSSNDAPIPNLEVSLIQPHSGWGTSRTTGADGIAVFEVVTEGAFVASVVGGNGSVNGTVTTADLGQTVDVTITETGLSVVTGRLTVGDGVTPVPFYKTLSVTDPFTGEWIAGGEIDEQGHFAMTVPSGRALMVAVEIQEYPFYSLRVTRELAAIAGGDTVTLALTMPLGIVTGRVMQVDGVTPVAYPSVYVSDTNGALALGGDETGAYFAFTRRIGPVKVTAQDPNSGLTGSTTVILPDHTQPVTADVTLQPASTVTGIVYDVSGLPVANAHVAVVSAGASVVRETDTDGDGRYTLNGVAVGQLTVQASMDSQRASRFGEIVTTGTTITLDLQFPAVGRVQGQVFGVDGLPLAGAPVSVQSQASHGPLGTVAIETTTDAQGRYAVDGIALGDVTVSASDGDYRRRGLAINVLDGSGPLYANVRVGNAVSASQWDGWAYLDPNYFVYDLSCSGDITGGGRWEPEWYDRTFDYGASLRLYGSTFPCSSAIGIVHEGRGAAYGAYHYGDLAVSRETYVPDAGGFIRYLETFSNPTAQPISLDVVVRTRFSNSSDSGPHVAPEDTSFAYTVARNVGFVAAGPTGGARPVLFDVDGMDVAVTWRLTVAPGQTVRLLHFLTQGDDGTVSPSLSALTHPDALERLTPEQRATIINFVLP